ncbi:hypothetical protein EVAR_20499_1 [Eumeta japonica]|uniref:Uncharacterized protein n=1 Tax=Eumeta variegata TaxID=151549 RepID=A0A4C1Y657_EUMVA|nr:hypothetical protein EVAR_20499_1 [Eumeta japonica]
MFDEFTQRRPNDGARKFHRKPRAPSKVGSSEAVTFRSRSFMNFTARPTPGILKTERIPGHFAPSVPTHPIGISSEGDFVGCFRIRKKSTKSSMFWTKVGHVGILMPSADDCPMGVFLSRHLGIGGHVKFTARTATSKGTPGGAGSAPD